MTDDKPNQTRNLESTATGRYLDQRATGPLDKGLPWVLELRIVGTNTVMHVQVRESMLMGREDPDQNVFPEIDLSPYHAFTHGVSRRHAVIQARNGRLTFKDLNSTNGSRLNGFDLAPHTEYRLRHGDELALGQLRLQVLFAIVPAHEHDTPVPGMPVNLRVPSIGKGQHVLLVEHDAEIGAVLQRSLEEAGFQVAMASSADSAEDEITKALPAVMVVDLMLPDLNSGNFMSIIRKQSETRIPVVVIGGMGTTEIRSSLEASGVMVLPKPLSVEELIGAVARAAKPANSSAASEPKDQP